MKYEFAKRMSHVKASTIREILKATADPHMISFAGEIQQQKLFQ